MDLSAVLLAPFRRFFCPPVLRTPFSTIRMPPLALTALLCGASFFLTTSGFVFCFVTGMPMVGLAQDERGNVIASWISQNGPQHQYLAEGLIVAMVCTLGAGALLAALYEIPKAAEDRNEFDDILRIYGCTAPLWPLFAMRVFQIKIPLYVPALLKPGRG